MADQIIPLTSAPMQQFQVALAVDGGTLRLQFTVRYNEMAGYWVMGLADAAGVPILDSIPLLTGEWPAANILAQYQYLQIGSAYVLNVSQSPLDYPDAKTLGSDFQLLWSDTPA